MKKSFFIYLMGFLASTLGYAKSEYSLVTCTNDDGASASILLSGGKLSMRLNNKSCAGSGFPSHFSLEGQDTAFDDFDGGLEHYLVKEGSDLSPRYLEFQVRRQVEDQAIVVERFEVLFNGAAGTNWWTRGKKKSEYRFYHCRTNGLW